MISISWVFIINQGGKIKYFHWLCVWLVRDCWQVVWKIFQLWWIGRLLISRWVFVMSKLNYSHDPHYPGLSSQPLHTGNNTVGTVKIEDFKIKMKKLFSFSKVNLEPTFTAHWYQIALKMQLNARTKQKVDQK